MAEKTLDIDLDICQRIEDLAWACRIPELVPEHYSDKHEAMGYMCEEYWHVDPFTNSIKLEVFPFWIDKNKFLDQLPEIWKWNNDQFQLMQQLVLSAVQKLAELGAPAETVEIPEHWQPWFPYEPLKGSLYGVSLKYAPYDRIRVFSLAEYGRFVEVQIEYKESK